MHTLVTGAAGILGRAVVETLHRRGGDLIAIDQQDGTVPGTEEIRLLAVDLGDPQRTRTAIEERLGKAGPLDAVVHLVGAFDWITVADSTPDDWWSLHAANIGTTLNVIRAATPHLRDGGAILCVGAAAARSAKAGMAPYAAAKSGIARIVEALSEELKPRAIRVNAVAPAIIDTPRNRADMPEADPADWTSPAAIAEVIAFLVGPKARAINGAIIPVTNNG
ncbi:conserved protein of unknown function [uncultured Sphingopyxis sp.]|uniref:Ketoreductase domain-containing protein n=1 Tax=uncultured Sphingopyxis sp. TaxID=310581 RepID=A0A1Y5PP46_9SPHN|nr:SDR family oxidoreductase [uncultured Sphingopyxis sp.]SBV31833.1 conserved protein of unknown function [uncultured Sphingopyxis sp.]